MHALAGEQIVQIFGQEQHFLRGIQLSCLAQGGQLIDGIKRLLLDTWGVDFVLLNAQGRMLGDAVSYRDGRTQGMDAVSYTHLVQQYERQALAERK